MLLSLAILMIVFLFILVTQLNTPITIENIFSDCDHISIPVFSSSGYYQISTIEEENLLTLLKNYEFRPNVFGHELNAISGTKIYAIHLYEIGGNRLGEIYISISGGVSLSANHQNRHRTNYDIVTGTEYTEEILCILKELEQNQTSHSAYTWNGINIVFPS